MIEIKNWPMLDAERCDCSICGNRKVYYVAVEEWMEKVETTDRAYLIWQAHKKNYCQECFYEYGGAELENG